MLRPAVFFVAAIASTIVLAGIRKRGFRLQWTMLWTLGTLAAVPVVFPAYLIYCLTSAKAHLAGSSSGNELTPGSVVTDPVPTTQDRRTIGFRFLLPLVYLLVVCTAGSIYFYRDWHSVDSHLARANTARLMGKPEQTIAEYSQALAIEDNPHTHNMLGMELANLGRWQEALLEFQAADRGREPDPALPYYLGASLEVSGQFAEAETVFYKFLESPFCEALPIDSKCVDAKRRVTNQREKVSR
jgi:hypothetical protein